jgi:hypothetical protein
MPTVFVFLAGVVACLAVLEFRARMSPPVPAPQPFAGPMTRARAIALGRKHAQARAGDFAYLEESLTDNQWQPHEWVLNAIEDAYEYGAVEVPF